MGRLGAICAVGAAAIALAACELVPEPKQKAPAMAVSDANASIDDAANVDAAAIVDAARDAAAIVSEADAGTELTADCVRTAEKIASVVIEGADPGVRGNYEQGRGKMVRMMAQACTQQLWSGVKQECFQRAKLEADIRACEAKYPQQPGAGSAGGSGA